MPMRHQKGKSSRDLGLEGEIYSKDNTKYKVKNGFSSLEVFSKPSIITLKEI